MATSASGRTGSARTDEEQAYTAIQNVESFFANYLAIISPSSNKPMVQLKKYGECTLVDPRACMHHYECAADVACILYAYVSLDYFHLMVHNGYISNKTRAVLHDIVHDTYVFVLVENVRNQGTSGAASVDEIIQNVQRQQGHCRPGIDVLQVGTRSNLGYTFSQPTSIWKKGSSKNHMRLNTLKVHSNREWMKRLKNEKAQHDCQREIFNQKTKQDMLLCRNPKDSGMTSSYTHIPLLVIEHEFNIPKEPR